jgi:hypothetical protein
VGWTIVANLVLAAVAITIYLTQDGHFLNFLLAVIFILLVGAADVAWEMLLTIADSRS